MIHRKTYKILEEGEKELVYEEITNKHGLLLSFKDYQSPDEFEAIHEYYSNKLIKSYREIINGIESSRTEYLYDQNQNLISRSLYVADELFEEVIYDYNQEGHTITTNRLGEKLEYYQESADGFEFTKEFFDDSNLYEKRIGKFDPKTNTEFVQTFDSNGDIYSNSLSVFDDNKNLLKFTLKNKNDNVLIDSEYKIKNDLVIFEDHKDYEIDEYYTVENEYDENNNLISQEFKDPSGRLIEYHKKIYDENNRLKSENGYSQGHFNAIYGSYVNGQKYLFEHDYKQI
ncbi:hypothetical protein OO013_15725 [Mangrovivirga sp. M17]|uniref:YD repeat-containing protein n=1 Tax=Mangrovivirga halotolerans TaxID=2993936 RepID=A0ABT3RVR5_9BACT|nr:hypothetical protein [Mangrovivirga halotolerans]MCX2745327.1 hypothetical protein [Mangrovivirga halotolerans]